ncbi:MAG: phage portal protein [Lachnospiraceae bacterium]|nr:phage portal protein [Lachnospiraceae bacterium]
MEEIDNIISGLSPDDAISYLTDKIVDVRDWEESLKEYEPELHRIVNDHLDRKDKVREDGSLEKAARIPIGLEQLLTKRICEFAFAIPVKRTYHNTEENVTRQTIAKAMEAIYKHARIDAINNKRALNYFASCEVFTVWYVVEAPNTLYGFNSRYKLKCKTYSPMDGTELYPIFDETGDLVAMSVKYVRKANKENVTYFETYTASKHYKWIQEGGVWKSSTDNILPIGKIPGVYTYRHKPIWHGLSVLREEIEYTVSRNSDVIAYNSAPILKIVGKMLGGKEEKGEVRRIVRVENGGDIGYVSWQQAIEALKYHVDTLTRLFWSQSQMPDISFANMMSLGNIGFDARQTLLTDAHLKIGDEAGAWIESFEREANVIKAFLKLMNTSWASEMDNVEVEHAITPFIQQDEKATIERIQAANGGKPIMSQLESIKAYGQSTNPEETLKQIREDSSLDSIGDVFM